MRGNRFRTRRTLLLAFVVAILGSGLAGSAGLRAVHAEAHVRPAALERARVAADALPAKARAVLAERGFAVETSRRAAPRVYLVEREGEQLCYVVLSDGGYSSGCNPRSDFFGDRAMILGLGQDRNGTGRLLTAAGIARPDVANIRVRIGNDRAVMDLNSDGGFLFSKAIDATSLPAAVNVDAVGANGRTIASDAIPTD